MGYAFKQYVIKWADLYFFFFQGSKIEIQGHYTVTKPTVCWIFHAP